MVSIYWRKIIKRNELTQEELKKRLVYNTNTGEFFYNYSIGGKLKGNKVGTLKDGYIYIRVAGVIYLAHRLAWLYIYGKFPISMLDHIDRNRSNNKISNLRESNYSQNGRNTNINKKNTSGIKGVDYMKSLHKWRSRSVIQGIEHHIGVYSSIEDARIARENFDDKYEKSLQTFKDTEY